MGEKLNAKPIEKEEQWERMRRSGEYETFLYFLNQNKQNKPKHIPSAIGKFPNFLNLIITVDTLFYHFRAAAGSRLRLVLIRTTRLIHHSATVQVSRLLAIVVSMLYLIQCISYPSTLKWLRQKSATISGVDTFVSTMFLSLTCSQAL